MLSVVIAAAGAFFQVNSHNLWEINVFTFFCRHSGRRRLFPGEYCQQTSKLYEVLCVCIEICRFSNSFLKSKERTMFVFVRIFRLCTPVKYYIHSARPFSACSPLTLFFLPHPPFRRFPFEYPVVINVSSTYKYIHFRYIHITPWQKDPKQLGAK